MSAGAINLAGAEAAATRCAGDVAQRSLDVTRAESIERSAREAAARADELAGNASRAHREAVEACGAVEARWSAAQSPELWREVENARGSRDQAELRARSLRVGADAARVDHEAAVTRLDAARASLDAARAAKVRADDVLRAFRRDQRERDEAEAAREGQLAREREAIAADRAAFNADLRRAAVPVLAKAVEAAEALEAATHELGALFEALRPRSRELRRRMLNAGVISSTQAPPLDITLSTAAAHVVAVGIFRALAPGRSGSWEYPLKALLARGDVRGAEDDVIADVVRSRVEALNAARAAEAASRHAPTPVPDAPQPGFLSRAWGAVRGA